MTSPTAPSTLNDVTLEFSRQACAASGPPAVGHVAGERVVDVVSAGRSAHRPGRRGGRIGAVTGDGTPLVGGVGIPSRPGGGRGLPEGTYIVAMVVNGAGCAWLRSNGRVKDESASVSNWFSFGE